MPSPNAISRSGAENEDCPGAAARASSAPEPGSYGHSALNYAWAGQHMQGSYYYVYLLTAQDDPSKHYVGFTKDLQARLHKHNEGGVPHTANFRPWQIDMAIAFRESEKALAFEKYLKSHSGRAFAKRHF